MFLKPPVIFQLNRVRQNDNVHSLRDDYGRWQSARDLHGSQTKLGQSTNRFFYHNGENTIQIGKLPPKAQVFRIVSMYYCFGQVYIVPYDCTLYEVGGGVSSLSTRELTMAEYCPQIKREDLSDDGADAKCSAEIEELDVDSISRSSLRFRWNPEGITSEAWFNGSYPKLDTQRSDQAWVSKLLPSSLRRILSADRDF